MDTRTIKSLDGTWQIIFDAGNEGRDAAWQKEDNFRDHENVVDIQVPSCWEETEQDYEGVAIYGKWLEIPEEWEGSTIRIRFDAVNYIAEVWVNDFAAGYHEGGYAPFELKIGDLLKYGENNFLSLRVIGPILAENKEIDGIGPNDMPHWRGAITGGIWQPVQLIVSNPVFISDVFIKPDITNVSAGIELSIENTEAASKEISASISISSTKNPEESIALESKSLSLLPGINETGFTIEIPSPELWSPGNPNLYICTVQLFEDKTLLDSESIRFGMRELTVKGTALELNAGPILIKGAFFEGLYPTRLAYPDSEEMARQEIQLAIDAGFNMIRPWRKPPPTMWLDLCDELGVMVVGGLPIECMNRWPTVTPYMAERIENEVRSAVLRDRNRACIIQWEIFNEIHREELARMKRDMALLIRKLDPTRMILDESGGFSGVANIYPPRAHEPIAFNDVHAYPGAPLNNDSYDEFLGISRTDEEIEELGLIKGEFTWSKVKPGLLSFVSEIGYGSLPNLVDNNERFRQEGNPITPTYRYHADMAKWMEEALAESGFEDLYPDLREFCLEQQLRHSEANKRMIEAIRSNELVNGYTVHALTDGDWVLGAGLIDLFRNPKECYHGAREVNHPRYLALQVRPGNVYAPRGARLIVRGINDLEPLEGELKLQVDSANGQKIYESTKKLTLEHSVSKLLEEGLDTGSLEGSYTARVSLSSYDGGLIAENEFRFDVYPEPALTSPETGIAILDQQDSLGQHLDRMKIRYEAFSKNTTVETPVFVADYLTANRTDPAPYKELNEFVSKGGTVVHLGMVKPEDKNLFVNASSPAKEILPLNLDYKVGIGSWIQISHMVKDHPVFQGLPVNCIMGREYENIWAEQTMLNTRGELIAGTVSYGWYMENRDKRNYKGPEPAWYGMDLGIVNYGEGRFILSALRILPNLGTDPVADLILINILKWLTNQ